MTETTTDNKSSKLGTQVRSDVVTQKSRTHGVRERPHSEQLAGDRTFLDEYTLADTLNAEIGVLTRREVEARIVAPLVDALGEAFGRDAVIDVIRKTIIEIAQTQGKELAEMMGGDSLHEFADSLQYWTQNNALEIDVLEENDEVFSFNVTRCRYAELYRALGIPELGAVLSCNRDFALISGFNDQVALTRTQTIMEGASCCDFRYRTQRQPIVLQDT